ncbi:MAG: 30S ribosome-binding factor RbfA [Bacteroides sp.]|nr:30S ribosome-binding factor RbfA [Prevotella sp.]MCM1407966.1 30S ribosome-binding factor RbfA [Treponema brennaborense]MCM1469708.1 30S ribosome-binding factor RbfA [Bacteroides sp.]
MSEFRLMRLGAQIRDEISDMILKQRIKDPRVSAFLSINRVEVAGDLSYAKVYVSSFMNQKQTEKGVAGLESAAGFIQSVLGKKLRLHQFPKLTFVADTSIKDGFEMIRKLNALEQSEKNISAVPENE